MTTTIKTRTTHTSKMRRKKQTNTRTNERTHPERRGKERRLLSFQIIIIISIVKKRRRNDDVRFQAFDAFHRVGVNRVVVGVVVVVVGG